MPENHTEAFAQSPIKVGAQYRFDYPEQFTSMPDYSARRGAIVTVVRPCTEQEADVLYDQDNTGETVVVDVMFKVRAEDGWEGDAWESELMIAYGDEG